MSEAPADGVYIHGLWLEGAHWDSDNWWLDESRPGVMFCPLPVVHFIPVKDYDPPDEYQCPLYKTSARAGVLSTTGQSTNYVLSVSLPKRPDTSSDFWILQGTALLCALND